MPRIILVNQYLGTQKIEHILKQFGKFEFTQHLLKSMLVKHAVFKVRTTNSIFKNLTKMGAKF
jgi:hypothetical protein